MTEESSSEVLGGELALQGQAIDFSVGVTSVGPAQVEALRIMYGGGSLAPGRRAGLPRSHRPRWKRRQRVSVLFRRPAT